MRYYNIENPTIISSKFLDAQLFHTLDLIHIKNSTFIHPNASSLGIVLAKKAISAFILLAEFMFQEMLYSTNLNIHTILFSLLQIPLLLLMIVFQHLFFLLHPLNLPILHHHLILLIMILSLQFLTRLLPKMSRPHLLVPFLLIHSILIYL